MDADNVNYDVRTNDQLVATVDSGLICPTIGLHYAMKGKQTLPDLQTV